VANRKKLPGVSSRRGAFFQAVPVPDRAFPGLGSHFKILSKLEAIRGAGILAKPAKHAARGVVGEISQDFTSCGVIAMPANYDQIFRARKRAQVARDAKRFPGFRIHIQARRAAIPLRDHGPLERILLRINVFGVLRAEGQNHALPEIRQEQPLQD